MSATVETSEEEIIQKIISICKRDPREGKVTTGGIVTVIVRSLFWKVLSILHFGDSLRRHRETLFLRQNTPSVRVWKQFTHL